METGKPPKSHLHSYMLRLTLPILSYFRPKHKDAKITENHLNRHVGNLVFIG